MPVKTTVIGSWPKPKGLGLVTDWFSLSQKHYDGKKIFFKKIYF